MNHSYSFRMQAFVSIWVMIFVAVTYLLPAQSLAKKKPVTQSKASGTDEFAAFGSAANSPEPAFVLKKVVDPYSDQAEKLILENKLNEATDVLWKNVEKLSPKGLAILGKIYEEKKDASELIKVGNLMIGRIPKDYRGYAILGHGYRLKSSVQGNVQKAIEAYNKALELNPKYEPAYRGLIQLYDRGEKSNWYELRALYQDMIQEIGNKSEFVKKLCEVNTRDGAHEVGISTCKQAIAMDSREADPQVYLGICYKETGDADKAIETWKFASKKFLNSEMAHYYYGRELEDARNFTESYKVYALGTQADKKSHRAWLGLAISSFEIRKYEESVVAFREACKLDRKTSSSLRKAIAYLRESNNPLTRKFEIVAEGCTF